MNISKTAQLLSIGKKTSLLVFPITAMLLVVKAYGLEQKGETVKAPDQIAVADDDRLENRLSRPLPTSTDTVEVLPPLFEKPYLLRAGDAPLSVENPGYASPSIGDIDGDGLDELLVGQFRDGKILICKAAPSGHYREGRFLEAGGDVARIPGVW